MEVRHRRCSPRGSLLSCSGVTGRHGSDIVQPQETNSIVQAQLIVLGDRFESKGGFGKDDGSECKLYPLPCDQTERIIYSASCLTDIPVLMEHLPSLDRHLQVVA